MTAISRQGGARRASGGRLLGAMAGLALLAASRAEAAYVLPLDLAQTNGMWNSQSVRGMPLSSVASNPAGSDGRAPVALSVNESGTQSLTTSNQFQGHLSFGGLAARADWMAVSNAVSLNGSNAFSAAVAVDMQLPRAYSGSTIVMVLRRAQVGAPFMVRKIDFAFGAEIPVPEKDESGLSLTNILKESYWFAEPYSTNAHASTGYYWSPHARKVYVIQAGNIQITWRKQIPYQIGSAPTNYVNLLGKQNLVTNGSSVYLLYTVNYIGSGSACKTPKKMYWTEQSFRNYGKTISVPVGRVGAVNIVYNNNFPKTVMNEYRSPGYTSPADGSSNAVLSELRTLWYDQTLGGIYAFNQEGRVFMELLGDLSSDGQTRAQLGNEVVDVLKQAIPTDYTADLGEPLVPPAAGAELFPEELTGSEESFLYTHQIGQQVRLYAMRKTENLNDCEVYWMEESVAGLRWPSEFRRYKLQWPEDVTRYSQYIRPVVATEDEAKETAIQLPTLNMPVIAYQDPLDQPRAKLTDTQKFYTYLTPDYPAHRTLLRYTSDASVAFERVFSWLDVNLMATNFTGSVATNLAVGRDYINNCNAYSNYLASYPIYTNKLAKYIAYTNWVAQNAAYTNYLALAANRGVNGTWTLYLTDDMPTNGNSGNLTGWNMYFLCNEGVVPIYTPVGSIPADGQPLRSTATVSGITNHVNGVQITLSQLNVGKLDEMDILLSGPRSNVSYVVSDVTNSVYTTAVTFEISDSYSYAPLISGTYSAAQSYSRGPYNYDKTETVPAGCTGPILTNFASLLYTPPVVANPGTSPGYVADPGAAPTPVEMPVYWKNELRSPRVVYQAAVVGDRIDAPGDEPGTDGYWAGHIHVSSGNLYNPVAYVDPLVLGFEAANKGAIIPVNAVPGANQMEVWWFRANSSAAGPNLNIGQLGFQTVYWPSVIGRYTLAWPSQANEIVLASKLGSGTLDTFEAMGAVYRQPDPDLAGYNPNEEHALMSGGMAFATRDDLNVTNAAEYSSDPFVLVEYVAADGRPAMSAFKVLREKPELGYVFDYVVPAGQLLQAPMPLPLLEKPVEGSGDSAVNYNTEPLHSGGDLPVGWNSGFADSAVYGFYPRFTWFDRKHACWVYRGQHAGLPALKVGSYVASNQTFRAFTNATAVVGAGFSCTLHASRQAEYLTMSAVGTLPSWIALSGLTLSGTPATNNAGTNLLTLVVEDLIDHSVATNLLMLVVKTNGTAVAQAPLGITCTNLYTGTVIVYSNRAPFLAVSPTTSNSFTMRYYYKTDASFDWPGLADPPAIGSIVPYLRPLTNGTYLGTGAAKTELSLEILYRPVWPESVPSLPYGATLAKAAFELPAVRDMKTARVLYQQSIAVNGLTNPVDSVVLHDATRAKYSDLSKKGLKALPGGIARDYYMGKYYFPNLPPHLAQRLYFDPNRGANGSVVLEGQFVDEAMGESYTLLNVLRGTDLAAAKALCPDGTEKSAWDNVIDALTAAVETFYENPLAPGTYIPNPSLTYSVGVSNLVAITSDNMAVDSYALSATGPGSGFVTLIESDGEAFTEEGDPVALHIMRVDGRELYAGEVKIIAAANPLSELVTFQHTADLAGRFAEYDYEWKIATPVDGLPPLADSEMTRYLSLGSGSDMPRRLLGGAGVQALCDNYVVMRYRPLSPKHPLVNQWSDWTEPKLAEGWIKRVLAGINPFNQRMGDLFNNKANSSVSMLTQAGKRWEGDVALNIDNINNYGLIEIYETILRRGRMLSIDAGYNYGPANDALLLAAGYLNDLYMMVGGEAWADAANPTIGIGTKDATYGDIATSLFAFKGQEASLLEEELALLRGRDDFLMPGVEVAPVYNRLVWNYTRGIDAGEVIYALNYNIQENPDGTPDGVINAEDAAVMFPQGHGDAYGHYLTALKGYYLLMNNVNFDWVPRSEAVNVLGQPVSVDYQDERKFAAAAVAVARTGRQIFDLTFRRDYQQVSKVGWEHFGATRVNTTRGVERFWGMDHWACRTGQGAYLSWVMGNAILPAVDPNPLHEGIQKIDRTTVPELPELATLVAGIQTALDNAEGGLNPLGIPEGGLAFDINPNAVVGTDNGTHFEQIYQRAKVALNNAVASFDDAKDVTRLMRSEQDSLADFQAAVSKQELAYRNALIELYGTPYPDDIGAGKTWKQGYVGPDLIHYAYVDIPETTFGGAMEVNPSAAYRLDTQTLPEDWVNKVCEWDTASYKNMNWVNTNNFIMFNWGAHGFFDKPASWTGTRQSPGKIQLAISDVVKAHDQVTSALWTAQNEKDKLTTAISLFQSRQSMQSSIDARTLTMNIADEVMDWATAANELYNKINETAKDTITQSGLKVAEALPTSLIVGLANGGDLSAPARSAIKAGGFIISKVYDTANNIRWGLFKAFETANTTEKRWNQAAIVSLQVDQATKESLIALGQQAEAVSYNFTTIKEKLRADDDAKARYQALVAEGDRVQEERLVFRQRAATVVQGYRTRDAAFRLFRNEKLERYKTLFDLTARYSMLAANAYDYETGLLGTSAGRDFISRIVSSRALGVVRSGEPQYAGSDNGDPGLSSALAEMKADWDVLRGRLGFNNPDAYGTTVSLRTECHRILPASDGDTNWKDVLQGGVKANILEDADVRRFCMQVDPGDGLPVPGIVLTFSTTIADGYNLFGQQLAAGDHAFSPSSFATKIFGVGTALIGYRGMDDPAANSVAVASAGGVSPAEPNSSYLDPLALSATPYIYLIPVGQDSMRSPPLGDTSAIRTWNVDDVAIPMPFNIGESDFSTKQLWQSSDSLTEPLYTVRKHQAFRPVSTTSVFSPSLYGANGTLLRSQFTNNRLVGRSVWNSQWKLVIPGKTLLNNPSEGLDRFIQTVSDVKLHFVTYSYSGN